jgi:Zn-dependent protease with chaperone function
MSLRARSIFILLLTISLVALPALAERTTVKQGSNLFSVQQDIEMGRQLSQDAESYFTIVSDSYPNAYMQALGSQLAAHVPGTRFPYQFKIIDDLKVDAFALPGGTIYVTSGLIQAAPTEPQLAGVLAHEIAHVVLRHATQQVSKAYSDENPNYTRSRVNVQDVLNDLDIGFGYGSDSLLFKYSPAFERDADIIATQILYDANFDPRQMTLAFTGFFNSHTNTANQAARVRREIQNMGGLRSNVRGDSPDLHTAQNRLVGQVGTSASGSRTDLPSTRMVSYQGRDFTMRYPSNWRASERDDVVTIAPTNGTRSGELIYGMRIATFEPQNSFFGRNSFNVPGSTSTSDRTTLRQATDELLNYLRQSNPNMRVVQTDSRGQVDGEWSITMEIANETSADRETDKLVTVLRPNGLLYYFIGVAPEREFNRYDSLFEDMITSVRFND